MKSVTVSQKYQIVLPKEIRESAGIKPGQKLAVFRIGGVIELVPVKDLASMQGSLRGLDLEVEREKQDRL